MNILKLIKYKNNKIFKFLLTHQYNDKIKIKNKNFNIFNIKTKPEEKDVVIVMENLETQEEINIKLLNFNLQLIPLVLNQEYEILKLQNYQQKENNEFLYELLFLGLKEKFLEYTDTKPIIEAFYQTGRINEKQYLTLTKHYYLEDREYE